jgi:hypothetical protein
VTLATAAVGDLVSPRRRRYQGYLVATSYRHCDQALIGGLLTSMRLALGLRHLPIAYRSCRAQVQFPPTQTPALSLDVPAGCCWRGPTALMLACFWGGVATPGIRDDHRPARLRSARRRSVIPGRRAADQSCRCTYLLTRRRDLKLGPVRPRPSSRHVFVPLFMQRQPVLARPKPACCWCR